jgi:predicted enzyme related to lactoylglutathione lyase
MNGPMNKVRLPGRPDTELVIVLDCNDLDRMAEFWAAALGYVRMHTQEPYTSVEPPEGEHGVELLLQRVPERKQKKTKNRLHLDIRVPDLDAEVERLTALGANVLTSEPVVEFGWGWHILADPEGNEFCVLQPPR